MLNVREGAALNKEKQPLGTFYKKRIDRKYRHVVELRPELAESLVFCDGLRRDQQTSRDAAAGTSQLRYELQEDSSGIYELEIVGNASYMTLSQLLFNMPSVVAEKGFVDHMVTNLMSILENLHSQGVYQLCLAPQAIFLRKGDRSPMLLWHGSSFQNMNDAKLLYQGFEDTVAPEVLAGEAGDARSDVWAIGALVKKLYESGGMPMEYSQVVKKAMAEDPDKRYQSVESMRHALSRKKGVKRTGIMTLVALAVAALAVFLFFDIMPQSSNVEFIDQNGLVPVDHYAEDIPDEPIEYDPMEYIDPEQLEIMDSLGILTGDQLEAFLDSVAPLANAEEIFRRQFEQQAQSMLTQLYSNEQMGSSQNAFIAKSQEVMEDLMQTAQLLGEQCDLSEEQATNLANQIIARIQAEKQRNVTRYGSLTNRSGSEE